MISISGNLIPSLTGGYCAVIHASREENHNGIIFAQADNLDQLLLEIRGAISLHFQTDGNFQEWMMLPLELSDKPGIIAITESTFSSRSNQYVLRTLVYDRDSIGENELFYTYKIGDFRITIPKFDKTSPKPELSYHVFTQFNQALQAWERTKGSVNPILKGLFAQS
jgi:hypothetical protein